MTTGFFSINVHGHIESAYIPHTENLYCKFSLVHGPDWSLISGMDEGLSQIARASKVQQDARPCVWNFPLEFVYKSTNVYGWPQLILSVYGLDEFGRDVIRGYASVRLPTQSCSHTLFVPLFTPVASSPFNGFLSWISGRLPEFLDPKFVSKSQGREVTRVQSFGSVKIQMNVHMKGLNEFGYSNKKPLS